MRIVLLLIIVGLLSCNDTNILETHPSPTGDYILQVELDNSKSNDEHLGFRLMKKNGTELDYVRTLASDNMKWAVMWYNDTTIMIDSHDIGMYGWAINKDGRLETMNPMLIRDAGDKCADAFIIKYGSHSSH
jgi:hypothetical protein